MDQVSSFDKMDFGKKKVIHRSSPPPNFIRKVVAFGNVEVVEQNDSITEASLTFVLVGKKPLEGPESNEGNISHNDRTPNVTVGEVGTSQIKVTGDRNNTSLERASTMGDEDFVRKAQSCGAKRS